MYEELVTRLRRMLDWELCDYDHNFKFADETIAEAADAIEELDKLLDGVSADNDSLCEKIERMQKPRWIPVTERLPECDLGAEVGNIEWISCGRVYAGCFGRGGKYRDAYFRTWADAGEGMDAKDADYWRAVTLPEPPKEEENDRKIFG